MNRSSRASEVFPAIRCSLFALTAAAAAAQDIPPGDFEVTTFAEGIVQPVALALTPDGRLLVTEKTGAIRIVADGVLAPTPFATLAVHTDSENGLLGLAVDPHFAQNGYVYAFASITEDEQQIIRFTDAGGVGVEQTLIRDKLPTTGTIHSGGGLKFGPDGLLYFSIGDNAHAPNAQDFNTLSGKLCRVNPDGSTPAGNPFTTSTGSPRAIYALGLRNPFRFCFAPDGRAFVMDVGSDGAKRREEINIVYAGDNCGWPYFEGDSGLGPVSPYREPVFSYNEQGQAVTGGVFYTGRQFPAELVGDLLHLEFVLNKLYRLRLDGDTLVSHSLLLELDGGPTDIIQHPDGTLLYCEFYTGKVQRIRYIGPLPPASDEPPTDSGPDDGSPPPDADAEPAGGAPPCGPGVWPAALGVCLLRMRRIGGKRGSSRPPG